MLRVAFTASEVRLMASAMHRAHPRLRFKLPALQADQNTHYIPARNGRPFLIALAADGIVKIGLELADGQRHPVVELAAIPNSRVRRTGPRWTWMPKWTEMRVLVAEYARVEPVPASDAGR